VTQRLILTTPANIGQGDSPKSAFDKCNANFTDLYAGIAGFAVNVLSFGADSTGSVDSSAAFTAAITAVSSSNSAGGTVYVPQGVYILNTGITVPGGVFLIGTGAQGSIIRPSAAMISLITLSGGLSGVQGLQLVNVSAFATNAINVTKTANNLNCIIEKNYIALFSTGVLWSSGDMGRLDNNVFINNTVAFNSANDFRNSVLLRNYVLGGNGFSFNKSTQGPEGVTIDFNVIQPATAGVSYCLALNACLEFSITNNIFDQTINGNAVQIDATTNTCANIKLTNNWMGRRAAQAGAAYGLIFTNGVKNLESVGNTYVGWQQAGIYGQGTVGAPSLNFRSRDDIFYFGDQCVREIQLIYATQVVISGITFFSTSASIIEQTGCSGRIDACWFTSVLPTIINLKLGLQSGGALVNLASGVGTLLSGATSVTVTHGINTVATASAADTLVNFTAVNGDMGPVWLTNFTATTFQINVAVAPTANTAFSWKIDMSR
jgi:hypothetical protein